MRNVYVPFSLGTRCALVDWNHVPAFHSCALAPSFDDEARLELYSKEDLDRWKGLISLSLARALATARDLLDRRAAQFTPQGAGGA